MDQEQQNGQRFGDAGGPAVSRTHAAWGSGHPRLLISHDDIRMIFDLRSDVVGIGSDGRSELSLEGLAPLHAEIHHDRDDEYVLVLRGPGETSTQSAPLDSLDGEAGIMLRTGAGFSLGPWTFVFQRDEYADHGRPYGGREGGEGDEQREQPPRPDYTREAASRTGRAGYEWDR